LAIKEPKYVLASKLREGGLSYPKIAKRMGVKLKDAHAYVHYGKTRRKVLRRQRRYQQERHKRRMAHLRGILGGRCDICRSTSRLEIHHVNPLNKSGSRFGTWYDTSTLRLLCHFCHDFIGSEWYYGTFRNFRQRQKKELKTIEKSCKYYNNEANQSSDSRRRAHLLKKVTECLSEAQEIKDWLARTCKIKNFKPSTNACKG